MSYINNPSGAEPRGDASTGAAPRTRVWLRRLLMAGVAGATLLPALAPMGAAAQEAETPVEAEDDAAPEVVEDDPMMERMTVTARRREETAQDVPLAITAFDGDELVRTAVQDITFLSQTVPNVTLEVSRGTNTTITAFIRGVGQQDPVAGFEAGVGIYVDDVYFNRPQAAILDVYDVERIEVLRGPQGTLYGRNTIGGAIKYVTKRLSDEREFNIRLTGGSFNQFDAVFTASLPLTDTLRVGGAVARFTRDGFGDNLTLDGIENYQRDVLAARASLEFEPTSNLFFRIAGDVIDDDSDPRQGHRLTVGNLSGAPVLDNVFDTRAGLNNPIQEVNAYGISFLAEWQVNDRITIKNILAYREDRSLSPIDFDSLPSPDLDVPVIYDNQQLSEELQLLYEGDYLAGVVGFYYLDANAFNAFDVILGNLGDVIGVPGFNSFTLGDVDTETWSIFGDFTLDLGALFDLGGHGLELSFGGRYTSDERTALVLRQTLSGGTSEFFGGTAVPIATTSDFVGSEKFTDFSPRVSLAWQPVPAHNIYLTYSEGFKGGFFDPRGLTSQAPDVNGDGQITFEDEFDFLLVQPEEVDSFEIGVKSTWFEGRVNTSLAIFFSDYTDVQIPGSFGLDTDGDGLDDQFIGITTNAAEATLNGVEFEGSAFIAEDMARGGDALSLAWTFGYIDAEFDTFIGPTGENVADERFFQNTPKYTASGTLTYETPLSLFDVEGTLSLIQLLSYRSFATQFEFELPLLDQDGFTLYDASLVWESEDGTWRAGIHGKNLGNTQYKVAGYNFPTLGLEGTVTAFFGNPRQVLGTVEVRF
ncbi:MAG: TonB-dependent receptor [Alphaproteobacteria bacterium]